MKGGRKPKFEPDDRVRGRESAPGSFRDRTGRIVSWHARAEYQVEFDDGVTEFVMSWWIEPT